MEPMNRDQLKTEVEPCLAKLDTLQRQLVQVLTLTRSTLTVPTADGSNRSVMKALADLKANPECPANIKPILNKMHKAFHRNAEFNLEESVRERREELEELKPAAFQSKRSNKEKITDPESLLRQA
jgi:hypothetical protein